MLMLNQLTETFFCYPNVPHPPYWMVLSDDAQIKGEKLSNLTLKSYMLTKVAKHSQPELINSYNTLSYRECILLWEKRVVNISKVWLVILYLGNVFCMNWVQSTLLDCT